MISKVIKPAKSFARVCRYLLEKREGARLILAEGVREYDYRKMAEDFDLQARENPNLSNPVQHIILAFPPGEDLQDEKLAEIAREYLRELDIIQTQYVVVSHREKEHKHLHIVLNRVGNDGRTIKDNFLGLRGKKKAQELTQRHGLTPAEKKDLKKTHIRQMNAQDRTRYEIYQAIQNGLVKARDIAELEGMLKATQIETIYKYKGQTKEVQGVSFKKGQFRYKGSDIDRRFSYRNLQKILDQKREIKLHPGKQLGTDLLRKEKYQEEDLISLLLKPEERYENTPAELLRKKRERKSKGLGL